MYFWSYSLEEFLHHSNEDVVCSDFISKLVARSFEGGTPPAGGFIRIADVGCGPASKAVAISRQLMGYGIRIDWDLIDIDGRWREAISRNIRHFNDRSDSTFNIQCPVAAETWCSEVGQVPDVALFVHVAYDDESEDMVYRVAKRFAADGSLIIIGTEHPESALSLIRRKISALGYSNLPHERATALAARFRNAAFVVEEHVLAGKYLDVGDLDNLPKADWFWSLIFGEEERGRDRSKLVNAVNQVASACQIPDASSGKLNIPDLIVTVRRRT
jgi:hypothetical protein